MSIPKLILSMLTLQLVCFVQAQDTDWRLYKSKTDTTASRLEQPAQLEEGKITYHVDHRITRIDSLKRLKPTPMDGYRVQLFFGSRDDAQDMRVEFLRKHPDVNAYISYLAPNFRLRVGDFRSRLASEKFKNEIAREFPGCYIVRDEIELPPLQKEDAPKVD